MVRYDTYCDTGITIRYISRYIYYPLIYEMQNCVIEVPIRINYNIWGNTYHDTIFSLAMRIVGAVYRYIVIHWLIVTSLIGTILACRCTMAGSFAHQAHKGMPVGVSKILESCGCRNFSASPHGCTHGCNKGSWNLAYAGTQQSPGGFTPNQIHLKLLDL